jgi:hypothetical protein
MKEISICGAGLQGGYSHTCVAKFVTKTMRKREQERLGGSINSLSWSNHLTGDGCGEEDLACLAPNHVADNVFRQVDRSGAIEVDHVELLAEISLLE